MNGFYLKNKVFTGVVETHMGKKHYILKICFCDETLAFCDIIRRY